ncbi:enoyl-[acyl-carrier protein] reductase II [Alkalihalobacillus xiaoxiensis]|uniref:Probable nitronate monooxygenase n=1 Tax=Shouchella xiaoxiensis TaxID=766895 RepID=A0ABS2SZ77_9BACI|nr:nitronate monooxygenase [Shouchella xiaoxiensis]MBM7840090.1 enoyl-[acyl-carrier protein] reductase II [Shouchella xiaoxiensis]
MLEKLQIHYPIVQGGMGNISDPRLVASVSEAGGLGTIGCGTMTTEEVLERILETKRLTKKPFALNIPIAVNSQAKELVQLAIEKEIPIVSLSAGNPSSYLPLLKAKGIVVLVVIASVAHAKKAEELGADILVAEGFEAAGINAPTELTTFTLLPQVVSAVQIPVIAAGGVGDGRGLAAAFMLGASGVQMGTRFIATKDAPYHASYKQKLLEASDTSTTIVGRKYGQVRRVLKGPYVEKLLLNENKLSIQGYQTSTSEKQHVLGAIEGDDQLGFVNSGQVAGLLSDLPTVKQLIERMMSEAETQITNQLKVFKQLVNGKS